MASTEPPISQQEIISTYRQMNSEMQSLIQQLTKAEMERNEHRLVEETLEPLDPDRRAFRLVGGVLVERTVKEVLPSVKENRVNLDTLTKHIEVKLEEKRKETFAWKAKYNIKTQEEMEAAQKQ
ncbi:prefoldin subunit 2 [Skeletonema marinoi]|uniref:Prefoldin subunit 2 n=1 Tax=Skeletonema marinoi TaxID=267567 RepID=A0AAD8YPJ3_9STRA|nr:prefoldin subunit 2 [Skeletonema marinoi]|mmetsp:Transcript_29999/g.60263  ORF Transcript_29999/g.60263 Transcript_29999/m.60263 type:complete len:124 (-) Transcript_29999:92-463(-)|eukprot:CAMPEP_0113406818 /NCGR_PEP_ID=MMETSP0013_2-20120614/19721_1 /TAXON_ID=2843 ORGANISM="Skeletonema costatum, Strain 1716" /NCGR_SAMPLE_ID=MMETSP0013_2 /ASSEMBLY_ACC=CAM_ASM_000158 /LENGTH=123 /DNA_ID=CAMNT_0000292703 /DNA_START=144 /DNA_END=515 /DNA_ORIENTATION=+ /assembly_acc=CAM_ASM_000158